MKKIVYSSIMVVFITASIFFSCNKNGKKELQPAAFEQLDMELANSYTLMGGFVMPTNVSYFANAFKNASDIISNSESILSKTKSFIESVNIFKTSKQVLRKVAETKAYLNELNNKLSDIEENTNEIRKDLISMEHRIVDEIKTASILTPNHQYLKSASNPELNNPPNIDEFRRNLLQLSKDEYRPTKMQDMIYYYEFYINSYGQIQSTNIKNQKKEINYKIQLIEDILLYSITLERSFVQFSQMEETRIDLLSNQLLSSYILAKRFNTSAPKNNFSENDLLLGKINLNDPLHDFDLKEEILKPAKKSTPAGEYIYDNHIKIRDEIIKLSKSRIIYIEATQAIIDYRKSLYDEKRTLKELV